MRREQNAAKAGWTCEDRVELESSKGARSVAALENGEKDRAQSLIESSGARGTGSRCELRERRRSE